MKIAVDFTSIQDHPRNGRPIYHLLHFALLVKKFGYTLKAIVNDWVIAGFPVLREVMSDWTDDRNADIYIARSDIFFYDDRWHSLKDFRAFKVCLNTLDFTYQETLCIIDKKVGSPVHHRCDLYLPVNYSGSLITQYGYKVIPIPHTIDHRMVELFKSKGVYEDYVLDNLKNIRQIFSHSCKLLPLGFMGNINPNRGIAQSKLPKWVDFSWRVNASSLEYIKFLCSYQGSLDIRGYGDKNIRMIESVLFGRTVVTVKVFSQYAPPLINNQNCLLRDTWDDYHDLEYDPKLWLSLAEAATSDYLNHWSPLAQFRMILKRYAEY